jgi:translation elongation factor EF-Tu-like GTPase
MGLFDIFKRKNEQVTQESMMNETQSNPMVTEAEKLEAINGPFFMRIDDIFQIGQELVVIGYIEGGTIRVNDTVKIEQTGLSATVTGLEQFAKKMAVAQAGNKVGIRLANISRTDIEIGYNLVK